MTKKLTRSAHDKMVSGVAAGIADYVGLDPVIVRLIFALAILSNPPLGLLVYLLLAIIMPVEGKGEGEVDAAARPFNEDEIQVKGA